MIRKMTILCLDILYYLKELNEKNQTYRIRKSSKLLLGMINRMMCLDILISVLIFQKIKFENQNLQD